jgi:hypothetical protein
VVEALNILIGSICWRNCGASSGKTKKPKFDGE